MVSKNISNVVTTSKSFVEIHDDRPTWLDAPRPEKFPASDSSGLEIYRCSYEKSRYGRPALDRVSERRLSYLETFEGDSDLGFDRPNPDAVKAVRFIISSLSQKSDYLKPPVISPAADGEIIVSWRRSSGFLVLSFETGSDFDWVFKTRSTVNGTSNVFNGIIVDVLLAMLDSISCVSTLIRTKISCESSSWEPYIPTQMSLLDASSALYRATSCFNFGNTGLFSSENLIFIDEN